jgi:hypothetical protein
MGFSNGWIEQSTSVRAPRRTSRNEKLPLEIHRSVVHVTMATPQSKRPAFVVMSAPYDDSKQKAIDVAIFTAFRWHRTMLTPDHLVLVGTYRVKPHLRTLTSFDTIYHYAHVSETSPHRHMEASYYYYVDEQH